VVEVRVGRDDVGDVLEPVAERLDLVVHPLLTGVLQAEVLGERTVDPLRVVRGVRHEHGVEEDEALRVLDEVGRHGDGGLAGRTDHENPAVEGERRGVQSPQTLGVRHGCTSLCR
jgi:hypothetical protein